MGLPMASATVLERMQAARLAQWGAAASLGHDDAWFASQLLAEPASPYSGPIERPEFTNETWWPDVLDTLGEELSEATALAQLRTELGMTRARPGIEVTPRDGFRDPFVAAHAAKAGLDSDIFWHVLDIFGFERSRYFASRAMGLQLLRESMAAVPAERQVAMGVYRDVLLRFQQATQPDDLTEHDLKYLDTLVQHRLLHPGRGNDLPMTWRIARVAAAFRDAQGYSGGFPCLPNATPRPRYAGSGDEGDDRPLCFVAATDRAVHRWHINDLRSVRLTGASERPSHVGFGVLVGALLPVLDILALADVIEAAVADDMVTSGAMSRADAELMSSRSAMATCRIPE
jgi:hypothetical protein